MIGQTVGFFGGFYLSTLFLNHVLEHRRSHQEMLITSLGTTVLYNIFLALIH